LIKSLVMQFDVVYKNLDVLLGGILVTFCYSIIAMLGGSILGVVGALCRRSKVSFLNSVSAGYVGLFRNTPLLIQLYLVYFGVPALGIPVSSWLAATVTLIINNGAYLTEIIRGGMEGIHKNEIDAGLALGMSRFQVLLNVIIPRLLRIIYPSFCNQFILIILSSSLLSMIAVRELFGRARAIAEVTFMAVPIYTATMVFYVLISIVATYLLAVTGRLFLNVKVRVF